MADNRLSADQPRMGWMIDGDPATPEVAVMLRDTGERLELTVPTGGMFGRGPYERWFMAGVQFGDDPDRSRYSYRPPGVLLFHDSQGSVALVGCRSTGMTSGLGAGTGRVVANFAVLGATNLRYSKVNGVRSELPALARWSHQRSVHLSHIADGAGRVQRVDVRLEAPEDIPLAHQMNLTLSPSWRTSYPDNIGTFSAHDVAQLVTTSSRPRSWSDHLDAHVAIRELLVLGAWHRFGFARLEVARDDDPERALSGRVVGPRWLEVATHRVPRHRPWKQMPTFLYDLRDVGTTGVRRWLRIRRHFARSMQPLIGIADTESTFLEPLVLQSGIALEALGYQLEVDNGGARLDSRGQLAYSAALDAVERDMKYVPVPDVADWKRRSRECYMAVKHADNTLPDVLTLANTQRENLLVLRAWLARRLGLTPSTLEKRVELDVHHRPYEQAD